MRRVSVLLLLAAAARGGELRNAVEALGQREPKAAAAIAKALDARPSGEEACEAIAPCRWPALASLAATPEGEAVVKRLLALAYPRDEPKPPAAPPAEQLARAAATGTDRAKRDDAARELSRCYGERSVPHLIEYMQSRDVHEQLNAYTALGRMGERVLLPLVVAARLGDAKVHENVVSQLETTGDPRALPVLLELARRAGPLSSAARAAAKIRAKHEAWAGDGTPAGAYVALAQRYAAGNAAVAKFPRAQPLLLWSLTDRRFATRTVERHVYLIELGKQAAADAIRLDPANAQARDLLWRFEESAKLAERLVAESRR